jgi:hypothetical protein
MERLRSVVGTGEPWDGTQRPPLQGPEGVWPESRGPEPASTPDERHSRPIGRDEGAARATGAEGTEDPGAEPQPALPPHERHVQPIGLDESAVRAAGAGATGKPETEPEPASPSNERHSRPIGSAESAIRAGGAGAAGLDDDEDPWAEHARLVRGLPGLAVLRIGVRPSRLPDVLAQLPTSAVTAGLGTGVATVALPSEAVADAHALVHAAGGTSVLRARPADADAPAWGPPPSAVGVLRALKAELDPQGRFGPGRFAPWF